jgi:hypothetical protein
VRVLLNNWVLRNTISLGEAISTNTLAAIEEIPQVPTDLALYTVGADPGGFRAHA